MGRRLFETHSNSTCSRGDSASSIVCRCIYFRDSGFGHDKCATDYLLRILRELAGFADLRADIIFGNVSILRTPTCLDEQFFEDISGC